MKRIDSPLGAPVERPQQKHHRQVRQSHL